MPRSGWSSSTTAAPVFVKAATEPSARPQVEREAALLESVGGAVHAVRPRSIDGRRLGRARTRGSEPRSLAAAVRAIAARRCSTPSGRWRRPRLRPGSSAGQKVVPSARTGSGLPTTQSRCWLTGSSPRSGWRWPTDLHAAESSALLAGDDFLHDDVWAGNVCYTERGAVLIDWASASIGDRRIDLAYALLSIRETGAMPPPSSSPTRPPMRHCSPAPRRSRQRSPSTSRSSMRPCFAPGGCTTSSTRSSGLASCWSSLAAGRMRPQWPSRATSTICTASSPTGNRWRTCAPCSNALTSPLSASKPRWAWESFRRSGRDRDSPPPPRR